VLLDGADADRMSDASGHPITPVLPRWSGSGSVNTGSSGAAQALHDQDQLPPSHRRLHISGWP